MDDHPGYIEGVDDNGTYRVYDDDLTNCANVGCEARIHRLGHSVVDEETGLEFCSEECRHLHFDAEVA